MARIEITGGGINVIGGEVAIDGDEITGAGERLEGDVAGRVITGTRGAQ